MTSLLALTDEDTSPFEEYFEEVMDRSLANVRINTGTDTSVKVSGTPIEEFDSLYINPDPQATIYGRVFLESIQEREVKTNLDPSSLTIMMKNHYLFKVLAKRNNPIPPAMAMSTIKGMTGLEDRISFPLVAEMYDGFKLGRVDKIEDMDSLSSFVERAEHGDNIVFLKELIEGELYDSLYIDGETISVKIEEEPWEMENGEPSMNYHSLPSEKTEIVEKAASSIGAGLCRVRIRGDKVVNVNTDPKLSTWEDLSGKDVYGKAARFLKGEKD